MHPHSLISVFIVRYLDSIIPTLAISKISSLLLASAAEQTGLSLTWSQTPKDIMSGDVTRFICCSLRKCFLYVELKRWINVCVPPMSLINIQNQSVFI